MAEHKSAKSVVAEAWSKGLEPEPRLSVWQWAEANRRLSTKASAEPGEYRVSRVPYTREIQEALSADSIVQRLIVVKASQLGFSEVANNFLGYIMDQAPGPALLVLPTLELAQRYSKQRLAPMIAESKSLSGKVREAREKDSGNSTLVKEFPGGFAILAGSNSAAGLRSMPARYLICDDVDAFSPEAGEEGDPIFLAERATLTYGSRRKILKISTPTFEGRSRIVQEWEGTDQRFYNVPCWHCGDVSPMAFSAATRFVVGARKFLEFDKIGDTDRADPGSVRLRCATCGKASEEHRKTAMLEAGVWIPTATATSQGAQGYHLSSLYSPLGWSSWREIVEIWDNSRKVQAQFRVVVNQRFGEPWREKGEAPDWKKLYRRRENYEIQRVPLAACVLTAGVDVQADRFEVEVKAWGPGCEGWSIDTKIIPGGPQDREAWSDLERLLATPYVHETGCELQIAKLCIDTGWATQLVYGWVRRQDRRRVAAIKGREGSSVVVSTPKRVDVVGKTGKALRRGVELWHVGVDECKSTLYAWLGMDEPLDPSVEGYPAGWQHFPQWGEEYFRQLCAEQIVPRTVHGLRRYAWEKIYERNEVLDCNVYAYAAATLLGLPRWSPERWTQAQEALGSVPPTPRARTPEARSNKPATLERGPESGPARPRGGYLSGYRGRGRGWLQR
jgi:phage terminase large subunit GpA-like protein